jgi:hypothetical protein
MRIGLIAALEPTQAGGLRAELPLAGRSVLGWQVALLQSLGAERVLCLCASTGGEVLRLQHMVEAGGAAFHALNGFAALPALVRAEDDLIILRDGLVPDPALVQSLIGDGPAPRRMIAAIPADHPLAAAYPQDFERIDAARNWAGLLVMRGAAVQQLADFPADADAVSVLLRLALQAGTPCRELSSDELTPESWLLADGAVAVGQHQQALIAAAAPRGDWRAPLTALAAAMVRGLAPRGLTHGAQIGAGLGLAALLGAVFAAGLGWASGGIASAAAGAFAARVSAAYAALSARLARRADTRAAHPALGLAVDALAALTLWFALAPWPDWTPLAVCGPLMIGLARLAARGSGGAFTVLADDRASLLLLLAIAAAFGLLPEATALVALALLAALLLRAKPD